MRKIIFIILACIILIGCEVEPEYPDYEYSGSSRYPTYDEYILLLDNLEQQPSINRTVIDQQLTALGIPLSYEYTYYQSGNYSCYNFNWNYWSSSTYEFIYYIDVDIWTTSGSLDLSMCSYYNGNK